MDLFRPNSRQLEVVINKHDRQGRVEGKANEENDSSHSSSRHSITFPERQSLFEVWEQNDDIELSEPS